MHFELYLSKKYPNLGSIFSLLCKYGFKTVLINSKKRLITTFVDYTYQILAILMSLFCKSHLQKKTFSATYELLKKNSGVSSNNGKIGANVVRAHARFPCGGTHSGH